MMQCGLSVVAELFDSPVNNAVVASTNPKLSRRVACKISEVGYPDMFLNRLTWNARLALYQ